MDMRLPTADVVELKVKHKSPLDKERFFATVEARRCAHFGGPFELDADAGTCKCCECGENVSPMFLLEKMMKKESRWMANRERYLDEMRRLADRSRTKCDHCGKMTRIGKHG